MEAAEELERLAKEVSELDGSEISQRIDRLKAMSDDANYSMVEWLSEELRAVGFRTCYKDGAEFLKTYCKRLEEEICEQEGQTLADQVEGSEAVKAAKHVYDEAAKAAKQAYDEVVRPRSKPMRRPAQRHTPKPGSAQAKQQSSGGGQMENPPGRCFGGAPGR